MHTNQSNRMQNSNAELLRELLSVSLLSLLFGAVVFIFLIVFFPSKVAECQRLKPGITEHDLKLAFGDPESCESGYICYESGGFTSGPIWARVNRDGKVTELWCSTGDHDSIVTWKID